MFNENIQKTLETGSKVRLFETNENEAMYSTTSEYLVIMMRLRPPCKGYTTCGAHNGESSRKGICTYGLPVVVVT